MEETTESESQTPAYVDLDVQYFLKELEFQVAIEAKARDRMENMVQYLLTTFAAIVGAVLLVNELQVNIVVILFIATLLAFLVTASAFYRSCRLRYITTHTRVTRNNIRCILANLGLRETHRLIEWEGNPSGFCTQMLIRLVLFAILCSLFGGATGGLGLLLAFEQMEPPWSLTNSQHVLLIVIPIVLAILIGIVLGVMVIYLKNKSEKFIPDPDWKKLPDKDL